MVDNIAVMLVFLATLTGATIEEEQSNQKQLCPAYLQIKLHTKTHLEGYEIDVRSFLDSQENFPIEVNKEITFFSWTTQFDNLSTLNLSQIIDDYINKVNANLVIVKWNTTVNFSDEFSKTEQMYNEAECLSHLLNVLTKIGADSLKFHLIAHGFKVNVFAVAAQMAYPVLIGRLSALDPSRDKFSIRVRYQPENVKLPLTDVIYTSLSKTERIPNYGHIIFFPNGGYHPQPGIPNSSPEDSSIRSVEYWAESIHTPDVFWSLRCNSWTEFHVNKKCPKSRALCVIGENEPQRARGYFYLTTKEAAPYGVGKNRPLQSADTYSNTYIDDY